MKMNAILEWNITPLETPNVVRTCSGCSNRQFKSSDKFRVNANKKTVDVWLIYKCTKCDSTWKMEVIVRKNVSSIDKELFCRFQENDIDLAWQYAFDKNCHSQNRIQINWDINYAVSGQLEELTLSREKIVNVVLKSKYELGISIKKIIQKVFPLSNRKLEQYYQGGVIMVKKEMNSERNAPLTSKIGYHCRIDIDKEGM